MAWRDALPRPQRYELHNGEPCEMAAEQLVHARVKTRLPRQFERQIEAKGLPCEAMPDGMAVRVDDATIFEPDALVRCGPPLDGRTLLVLDPMIVVEVASPSSQRLDGLAKLAKYFANPSIQYCLIVVPANRLVIHHRRDARGGIAAASHSDAGALVLDPPGISIDLSAIFP